MSNVATIIGFPLVAGVVGSGVTWLVSNTTKPLVGGAVTGGAILVTSVATKVFETIFKFSSERVFTVSTYILPIVFAITATAMGYPISIRLALLLTASNVAILMH